MEEKPKRKFWSWLKDYVVDDVTPMDKWFELLVKRRPEIKRYQWYISIGLQIITMILFVYASWWASGQCLKIGFEELNRSCDQCLARCAKDIMHNPYNLTQFGNTTITLVGG